MSEINFRFWSGKKMSVAYSLGDLSYEGFPTHYENEHGDLNKKCVVMQYTGLKDKNGKEIYEGDILEEHGKGLADPFVVKDIIPIKRDLYLSPKEDDWLSWPEMYKIIGNIYENPELLKDNN